MSNSGLTPTIECDSVMGWKRGANFGSNTIHAVQVQKHQLMMREQQVYMKLTVAKYFSVYTRLHAGRQWVGKEYSDVSTSAPSTKQHDSVVLERRSPRGLFK